MEGGRKRRSSIKEEKKQGVKKRRRRKRERRGEKEKKRRKRGRKKREYPGSRGAPGGRWGGQHPEKGLICFLLLSCANKKANEPEKPRQSS